MEKQLLSDEGQFPTEDIIFSHIAESKTIWKELFKNIHEIHPEFAEQWRYYNDGKSWLLKITKKAKTIFWLTVIKDAFRVTFYFGDKAETEIIKSNISEPLKEQYLTGKRFGKIRSVSLIVTNDKDIRDILSLAEIKLKIK